MRTNYFRSILPIFVNNIFYTLNFSSLSININRPIQQSVSLCRWILKFVLGLEKWTVVLSCDALDGIFSWLLEMEKEGVCEVFRFIIFTCWNVFLSIMSNAVIYEEIHCIYSWKKKKKFRKKEEQFIQHVIQILVTAVTGAVKSVGGASYVQERKQIGFMLITIKICRLNRNRVWGINKRFPKFWFDRFVGVFFLSDFSFIQSSKRWRPNLMIDSNNFFTFSFYLSINF